MNSERGGVVIESMEDNAPCDGRTRTIRGSEEIRRGVVLRFKNREGTTEPFSDEMVLAVEGDIAELVRPYTMIHRGRLIVSAEVHFVVLREVVQKYEIVLQGSGDVVMMEFVREGE